MDVVRFRKLRPSTQCVAKTPPLDEGSRHAHPDEGQPAERNEIDAREDPQSGDADRQEGEIADRQRCGELAAAAGRPHVSERSCV